MSLDWYWKTKSKLFTVTVILLNFWLHKTGSYLRILSDFYQRFDVISNGASVILVSTWYARVYSVQNMIGCTGVNWFGWEFEILPRLTKPLVDRWGWSWRRLYRRPHEEAPWPLMKEGLILCLYSEDLMANIWDLTSSMDDIPDLALHPRPEGGTPPPHYCTGECPDNSKIFCSTT